jgi:tetratricopeptide (TPR) repeat protein
LYHDPGEYEATMASHDLFISYRRRDAERVLPLVEALARCGVSVWFDQREIQEFAPITDEIRTGLAGAKALLAWYSEDYPKSRPCQMELTAALLAAQSAGNPRERVLVVNPAGTAAHIEPIELRDTQYAAAPAEPTAYERIAQRLAAHLAAVAGSLGDLLPVTLPPQYGLNLTGSNRFVGRLVDLWRIHSALHGCESAIVSATSAPGLAIVSGLGGVGKSLLAEEYALRFGAAYPGGLFWLRAYGNDPTREIAHAAREPARVDQFRAIAMDLGLDITGLDPRQVEGQLRVRLGREEWSYLWVIDDLASGLDADTVKAWLAPSPQGKTLVTTRSREYHTIGTALPLDVLDSQDALDLLCSRRTPDGEAELTAARGVVEDLGRHTLAVAVSAAALDAQAGLVSFRQFRENLANQAQDELEFAAGLAEMLPSGHETSVAATLLRSVRTLPEEGQDFLRVAARLAVAPVPPALVAGAFERVDKLGEMEAVRRAAMAQMQADRASLAEREGGPARLVHALVSRTMRFHDAQPARTEMLRVALVRTLNAVLPAVADVRTHAGLTLQVQHARALIEAAITDAETATLVAWVERYDYERGLYASSQKLLERVIEALRRILGEEHPDTLTSLGNLAGVLEALGDLEGARGLYEQVLQGSLRVLGEEHLGTLRAMNNLASTLAAQGDLVGARAMFERAVEQSRRVLGKEHPGTLAAMGNLAKILDEQGHSAGSLRLQKRVLEARRRVLGEEHADTLTSMNNLGRTLAAQGDRAGARVLHERVLEARRRLLGEEHPSTLTDMNNAAETLREQGDRAGAQALHERVLETSRRVLGEEHPVTLTSMSNLALTLRELGDLGGARLLQERVFDLARQRLGERHETTTVAAWSLFLTLMESEDADAALDVLRTSLLWLAGSERNQLTRRQHTVQDYLEDLTSRLTSAPRNPN